MNPSRALFAAVASSVAALSASPVPSYAQTLALPPSPQASPAPPPAQPTLEPREAYLQPAADRVAVRIESIRPDVTVGVSRDAAGPTARALGETELHWRLCTAPCTIWLRPGNAHLVARAEGLVPMVADLDVFAETPARVRLRTRTQATVNGQTAFYTTGVVSTLAGVVTAAVGWRSLEMGRPAAVITGFALLGAGALLLVGGVALGATHPMDLENLDAPAAAPAARRAHTTRWNVALAPVFDTTGLGLSLGGAL